MLSSKSLPQATLQNVSPLLRYPLQAKKNTLGKLVCPQSPAKPLSPANLSLLLASTAYCKRNPPVFVFSCKPPPAPLCIILPKRHPLQPPSWASCWCLPHVRAWSRPLLPMKTLSNSSRVVMKCPLFQIIKIVIINNNSKPLTLGLKRGGLQYCIESIHNSHYFIN